MVEQFTRLHMLRKTDAISLMRERGGARMLSRAISIQSLGRRLTGE